MNVHSTKSPFSTQGYVDNNYNNVLPHRGGFKLQTQVPSKQQEQEAHPPSTQSHSTPSSKPKPASHNAYNLSSYFLDRDTAQHVSTKQASINYNEKGCPLKLVGVDRTTKGAGCAAVSQLLNKADQERGDEGRQQRVSETIKYPTEYKNKGCFSEHKRIGII